VVKERARQSFVLLAEVEDLGDSIRVPYDRERVKNAPAGRPEPKARCPKIKRPHYFATTASTIP